MKWTLLAVAAVLLLSFPQLAGIATHPVVLALGAGVIADATARRARTRRGRR
ncbi:hypothetical protein [Streptomyces griseosporeus]|uniref:hypothetical protein n=1 Tax=Streptomyces griseosporeus TaxID=1910 RepID=UPI0036FD4ACD